MRRLFLAAAMCALLFACGKKADPGPPTTATVEYRFEVATSTSFGGTYLNAKNVEVDTGFSGKTFSKTIYVTKASGFRNAVAFFSATDLSVIGAGTFYVLVNGNIVSQRYFNYDAQKAFGCNVQVF